MPLWVAVGAVLSLAGAVALILKTTYRTRKARMSVWLTSVFVLLLIPPSIFSYWYYTSELHRISPEIASVGLALISVDWIVGSLIAIILITAGAYQISKREPPKATISASLTEDTERNSFHESFAGLLLIVGNALTALGMLAMEFVEYRPFLGVASIGRYISMPTSLLVLATVSASFHLCWLRFRSRKGHVHWKIAGLLPVAFFQAWFFFALILLIGIPTLRAFGFMLWLGPIDFLSFFGLR